MENNNQSPSTHLAVLETSGLQTKLTDSMISELEDQRNQFAKFIQGQLRDQIDYGKLPGGKTPALWKPGAEKLASIYQMGSRIIKSERILELKDNFAMFCITIEIFHVPTGKAIAQCEAIANSHEKKWKTRKIYEWNDSTRKREEVGEEETPVGDILNTLCKMCQKRAYVGGVIIATKASDFFTQDVNEDEEQFFANNPGVKERADEVARNEIDRSRSAPRQHNIDKSVGGAFENFKPGPIGNPPPVQNINPEVEQRNALTKVINAERTRLKWSPTDLKNFVMDNFGKQTIGLSLPEMEMLVAALKRQEVKK